METIMAELSRINATVPKQLREYADRQVKAGAFGNTSEYVRHLIRQDQENARQQQIDYFNARIKKSLASGISKKTPAQRRKHVEKIIQTASKNKS